MKIIAVVGFNRQGKSTLIDKLMEVLPYEVAGVRSDKQYVSVSLNEHLYKELRRLEKHGDLFKEDNKDNFLVKNNDLSFELISNELYEIGFFDQFLKEDEQLHIKRVEWRNLLTNFLGKDKKDVNINMNLKGRSPREIVIFFQRWVNEIDKDFHISNAISSGISKFVDYLDDKGEKVLILDGVYEKPQLDYIEKIEHDSIVVLVNGEDGVKKDEHNSHYYDFLMGLYYKQTSHLRGDCTTILTYDRRNDFSFEDLRRELEKFIDPNEYLYDKMALYAPFENEELWSHDLYD